MPTDQSRPLTQSLYESAPSSRQTARFLTAAIIGASLLFLSGLTLTGTVLLLILATPVFVLFSPILVPAVLTIFLVGTGVVFAGGFGVPAVATLTWIYNYITGKHPPGADRLEYAQNLIADKARDIKVGLRSMGSMRDRRLKRPVKSLELREGNGGWLGVG